MAVGFLQQPGTRFGPCAEYCRHRDCNETRAMATGLCRYCQQPIGYDRGFVRDHHAIVHAECLEAAIDHAVSDAIAKHG